MTKEAKMQIVIDNYFKSECDVNTSIRKAFEKGFRIGVQKGSAVSQSQIDNMPTIDAVEVGRCKDCKHNSFGRFLGNTYCDLGIGLYQLDNFCSRGERRTDETC